MELYSIKCFVSEFFHIFETDPCCSSHGQQFVLPLPRRINCTNTFTSLSSPLLMDTWAFPGANINKAAMNILVEDFRGRYFHFSQIYTMDLLFYTASTMHESSTFSPLFSAVSCVHFSHSNGWAVASHFAFP